MNRSPNFAELLELDDLHKKIEFFLLTKRFLSNKEHPDTYILNYRTRNLHKLIKVHICLSFVLR